MGTFIGLGEVVIFLYLTNRTLKNTDYIIDNVIYCYLCQIFNYKFFNSIPWWSVGIDLYPADFLVVLMIFILFMKKVKLRKNWFTNLWFIFFILVSVSMIRGFFAYGFTSDFFGDLRKYLYFNVGILYFSYITFKKPLTFFEKKIDKVFMFITVYIWLGVFIYLAGYSLGSYGNLDRPLLSDHAIIMAAYTAYKWYKAIVVECSITFLPILYTVTLVVNRFNTTWVSLAVAICLIIVLRCFDIQYKKMPLKMLYQLIIMVFVITIVYIFLQNTILFSTVEENFDKFDPQGDNTFHSRIELWSNAISTINEKVLFLGQPMGSGMYINYRNSIWQVSIHNGYLELIFRTGLFGLVTIVLMIIGIISKALIERKILIVALILVMIVYWIAYNITFEQGMLIGLCSNYLLIRRNRYEMVDFC